ncbi:hypothetical protein Sam46_gp76 [Bacillus phage vB_BcM_Sam46]|uniref:Uncharacterized protein n=2 Tax=Caudoviricetes TaxID=2731619 RepID=A0A6G9L751_9CAUD|nr:hypothetical protein Sam112_gp74 [Bacillus phage vB_BcM_Sam112]QIQ61277.1 hypothetical protein Sam46_gp76 [Bacillus phage vB_BcM_Sam46]
MNFEEFKRRYIEKLKRAGISVPEEFEPEHEAFADHMATIYVGLTIYSEFQNDEMKRQFEQAQKDREEAAMRKIYVPDGIKH